MTTKRIIRYPSDSLRTPCRELSFPLPDWALEHIRDLEDTLESSDDGLAIASNQVMPMGCRVFVVRQERDDVRCVFGNDIAIINPSLSVPTDGTTAATLKMVRESCLSFPGISAEVQRITNIEIKYQRSDGSFNLQPVTGLIAQMIQHECDHLDGKLFIDLLSRKERVEIRNQATRNKKAGK